MRKRLVFSSVVSALSIVALGGAVAVAGGGGFGPGTFTFKDLNASATLTDSTGAVLFLSVDRGIQTFKLRGVSGPPVMVGPETVLSYSGFSPNSGSLFGCFVIPDSSFTVASGLTSAQLQVDPSVETPCPGLLIAADRGGRPGLTSLAPDVGGGTVEGTGAGITATLTWTSNGAVTDFSSTSSARCQTAVDHAVGSSQNTFASVTGSISVLTGMSAQFASIDEFETTDVTTGTFSNACTGA